MELIKTTIRKGVFETNSSSTHSITICSEEKFKQFERGELYYNDEGLLTKEEVLKEYEEYKKDYDYEESFEDFCEEENFYKNYEDFLENTDDYEDFKREYESKSGDKIVAFGYHGQGC